jgi:predicted Zn-dependent protease
LKILDELLSEQPDAVPVLGAKGDLLAGRERWPDALAAYDAALAAMRAKNKGMTHPPSLLLRKRNEAQERMLASGPPGV